MQLQPIVEASGILASLATVLSLYLLIKSNVRKRAEQDEKEHVDLVRESFTNGKASRNDEMERLRSERDEARRQRDETKAECRDWERRYLDLRDGGRRSE